MVQYSAGDVPTRVRNDGGSEAQQPSNSFVSTPLQSRGRPESAGDSGEWTRCGQMPFKGREGRQEQS